MGGGGGGTQSATIMIWGYGRGTALIWGVREYHKVENRCLSGLKSQCRCQIHNRPFLTCCIGESIWSTYPNYQKNAFNDFLRKSNGFLFSRFWFPPTFDISEWRYQMLMTKGILAFTLKTISQAFSPHRSETKKSFFWEKNENENLFSKINLSLSFSFRLNSRKEQKVLLKSKNRSNNLKKKLSQD